MWGHAMACPHIEFLFYLLYNCFKSFRVIHSKVGKGFPVEGNSFLT